MIIAKVAVSGVHACVVSSSPIPAGIIGAQITFEYKDPLWEGLSKTVVFTCGAVTKDVLGAGDTVTIPAEVVTKPGAKVRVGVYGTTADGILAVPTLWADVGVVRGAADPSGDESADPQLPVWAQIQNEIDDLKMNGAGGKEYFTMLVDADMLPAVHDASGAILTDENGNVILRY